MQPRQTRDSTLLHRETVAVVDVLDEIDLELVGLPEILFEIGDISIEL